MTDIDGEAKMTKDTEQSIMEAQKDSVKLLYTLPVPNINLDDMLFDEQGNYRSPAAVEDLVRDALLRLMNENRMLRTKLERAYQSHLPQWQPIDTAPRDTTVLLAKEFDGPGDWRIKCGYFSERAGWTIWGASWTPTHWMPLPSPPE